MREEDAGRWKMTNIMIDVHHEVEEIIEKGHLKIPNANTWIHFVLAKELIKLRASFKEATKEN